MVDLNKVKSALPPFKNELTLVTYDQSTGEIVKEILDTHREYETDYDHISAFFDTGDLYTTCNLIWDFLKFKLVYTAESTNDQTVKSPAAILTKGLKIDCKHYSLFAGGVLGSLQEKYQDFDWCYRFAGYKSKSLEHVFVVVNPGTKNEIWIDPVFDYFDSGDTPKYYTDRKVMALYKLSGVTVNDDGVEIDVDRDEAIANFLTLVNNNYCGWKDLMRSNMTVVNNQVKNYFRGNERSFMILMNILNG